MATYGCWVIDPKTGEKHDGGVNPGRRAEAQKTKSKPAKPSRATKE